MRSCKKPCFAAGAQRSSQQCCCSLGMPLTLVQGDHPPIGVQHPPCLERIPAGKARWVAEAGSLTRAGGRHGRERSAAQGMARLTLWAARRPRLTRALLQCTRTPRSEAWARGGCKVGAGGVAGLALGPCASLVTPQGGTMQPLGSWMSRAELPPHPALQTLALPCTARCSPETLA